MHFDNIVSVRQLIKNELPHDKTTNGMSTQRPESLLCTQWVSKDPSFLHVDSENSDQTGRMTCHFVGFVMRQIKCVCCRNRIARFDLDATR